MLGKNALSREESAHRKCIIATIGQRLREEYDAGQRLLLSDRLSDLIRKIEQSSSEASPNKA
jgi:hypothetical protein